MQNNNCFVELRRSTYKALLLFRKIKEKEVGYTLDMDDVVFSLLESAKMDRFIKIKFEKS